MLTQTCSPMRCWTCWAIAAAASVFGYMHAGVVSVHPNMPPVVGLAHVVCVAHASAGLIWGVRSCCAELDVGWGMPVVIRCAVIVSASGVASANGCLLAAVPLAAAVVACDNLLAFLLAGTAVPAFVVAAATDHCIAVHLCAVRSLVDALLCAPVVLARDSLRSADAHEVVHALQVV